MAGKNTTAESKQSKTEGVTASGKKGRLRPPKRRVTGVALVAMARAARVVGVAVLVYVLAFFAAVRVVPMVMGFVGTGTGLSPDMTLIQLISLWIAPSVFLIGLVFAAVLAAIRGAWRSSGKVLRRFEDWVLGVPADERVVEQKTKSRSKGAR